MPGAAAYDQRLVAAMAFDGASVLAIKRHNQGHLPLTRSSPKKPVFMYGKPAMPNEYGFS